LYLGRIQRAQTDRQYLADKLKGSTGYGFQVKTTAKTEESGNIYLILNTNSSGPNAADEGYKLIITKKQIFLRQIVLQVYSGEYRTIRQLLPARIELALKQPGPWKIATGTIEDYPAYSYRGVMLDVSRHFFGVDDVKKLIEFLHVIR